MKQIKQKLLFTVLLSLCCALNTSAEILTGKCGDNVSYSLNTNTYVIYISGTGKMWDFTSSYDTPWFSRKSAIRNVQIQTGVTSIGNNAFSSCFDLTSVDIPSSVTSIGECAFYSCSKLYSVTISEGVTSIGKSAFSGCSNLSSVTLPNSVTSIGPYAFSGCSNLRSMTIPNSVTSIGEYAFLNCSGLTSPVYNEHCFAYMPKSYKGTYSIPNGIEQISGNAFGGCSSLTSVTIPNSVTSIGECAFSGCSGLTSVIIPNSVTSIGDYTFEYCSGLTSVTCESTTPPTCGYYVFTNVDKSIPVYVPTSSVAAYKAATIWKDFTNIQSAMEDITVTSVSLNQTTANIAKGKTLQLSCTVAPSNATDKTITWKSSNTAVATVSSTGEVTAVGPGSATITATSANNKTATCAVTVTNPVTSIALNRTSLTLLKGGTSTLTVTYSPTDADNRTVTWKSSNTAVATVSTSGVVTAVGTGSATITATSANGKTATCSVIVNEDTRKAVITSNTAGATVSFSADNDYEWQWDATNKRLQGATVDSNVAKTVISINATKTTNISFDYAVSSEQGWDKYTITLDGNVIVDQISGISNGSYTNKISTGTHTLELMYTKDSSVSKNDDRAYFSNLKLETDEIYVSSITLNQTSASIEKGKTLQLSCTVAPSNATNKTVTWKSSNTAVATVSTSGVVTAVKSGTATITATSANGKTATCSVKVYDRGDASGDGVIDNVDITAVYKYILGEDVSSLGLQEEAADYNGNGVVTVTDAIAIIRLALTGSTAFSAKAASFAGAKGAAPRYSYLEADNVTMKSGDTFDMPIALTDMSDDFTNVMFDVTLPEGVTIENVMVGSRSANHIATYANREDGKTRVLCYSDQNANFSKADGNILTLTLKTADNMFDGFYDIDIDNIRLVRNDLTFVDAASKQVALFISDPTNVPFVVESADEQVTVYNVSGGVVKTNVKVSEIKKLPKGIYIVKGRKIVID